MKLFVALAVLCFLQPIYGQVIKDGHKMEQQNQENNQNNKHEQLVSDQNLHVVKPTVKIQHSSDPSKVSVEIPPKVQQIVTLVSQHVPQVVAHHVASHQRMVRSVKTRAAWQTMQVDAVEQPGKCEFMCNKVDVTVCGYNGRCYWQFESQCDLSTYNCLNTEKNIFHVVDFGKCQDTSAAKCYRGDL